MISRWRNLLIPLVCLVPVLTVGIALAEQERAGSRFLLAGYGFTHTWLGGTRTWVETADLVGRYETVLLPQQGDSLLRGYHSLFLELPLHLVLDPATEPMIGLNFLAAWTFTGFGKMRPYLFAGGGPLYTRADIPGLGAHLNGNYQLGCGVRTRLQKGNDLIIEYRFHHISNGSRMAPNDPLNSGKLLVGITF